MKIYTYQFIGNKNRQEDYFGISKDNSFFVLCDGVGGSDSGLEASQYVSNRLIELYESDSIDGFQLEYSIKLVSAELNAIYKEKNIATTLVAIQLKEGNALISSIGDSKLFYHDVESSQSWTTKDDSLVQDLMDIGVLNSEEDMRIHPFRNRITKALNSTHLVTSVLIDEISNVGDGDLFFLCSDGAIENILSHEVISLFAKKLLTFEQKSKHLEILASESIDNSTGILIQV